jgi:hypothetical protein
MANRNLSLLMDNTEHRLPYKLSWLNCPSIEEFIVVPMQLNSGRARVTCRLYDATWGSIKYSRARRNAVVPV